MGVTAGGLPYPEPSDPVAQGAAAIKALAEAVDTKVPPTASIWSPSSTALSGGTWNARQWRTGPFVALAFSWTMGATAPTGDVTITLPSQLVVPGSLSGTAYVRDISPSQRFLCLLDVAGGVASILVRPAIATSGTPAYIAAVVMSPTVPMAWVTGDQLYGFATYLSV